VKTRTVIIDDEAGARDTLSRMVGRFLPTVDIVAEAADVRSGIHVLTETRPDVVLLDIKMADGTGFDLLQQLPNLRCKVIFVTAYSQYAVQAFKCSAVDYLLKPVDPDDLIAAFAKAEEALAQENLRTKLDVLLHNMTQGSRRIVLTTAESMHVVNVEEVIRCEASDNYTVFFLTGHRKILVSKTLKEYESLLLPHNFFRLHHSHLINLQHLERYDKRDGGIVMRDGSILPVSSRKKDQLMQALKTM
jgi:two-component system LytT family response regulator